MSRMARLLSPKGELTHRRIVDATVRVIATEGVRAVTHRRVAQEADASVGLVTYYFASTDALIAATLDHIAQLETTAYNRMKGRVDKLGADCAGIVEVLTDEVAERGGARRTEAIASLALTLELTDRRENREPFASWEAAQFELCESAIRGVGGVPDRSGTLYLTASLEGLFLFAVIARDPGAVRDAAQAGLERVLKALGSAGSTDVRTKT